MYTASFAFFEALAAAGVSHCFVNLGSDHPSMIEAMLAGYRDKKKGFPRIITCPSEMVAMSMADGYARSSGKPQCVIVHVDVGTQALGAAVHNAHAGRAPVLIFAGMSPFTQEGELRGSRSEHIHWLQDIPDQRAIVSQYCRYSAEIKTGVNIKQMVNRALQFASSDPQGPVYLCAAREVLEADMTPYDIPQDQWTSVMLGGLPVAEAEQIATALATAKKPLVVTGYAGHNRKIPDALVEMADIVKSLRVLDSGGSEMSFPANHPAWLGLRVGYHDAVSEADVIIVLDCDVPWIPTRCKPKPDATVFHIDVDPLKQQMPLFYIPSQARYRADALTAVMQITDMLKRGDAARALSEQNLVEIEESRLSAYRNLLASIDKASMPLANGGFGTGHLCKVLRHVCPEETIWAIEGITNTFFIHDNIQPTAPGSWIHYGGGGLGWSGGGALGIKLATDAEAGGQGLGKFVCQIVGDGSYMFSFPSSVYWISKRYNIPVLTIVLNNDGWNAPRKSHVLVYPEGEATRATNEEINISFSPAPDYGGLAAAAASGGIQALRVNQAADLEKVLAEAVETVRGGKTAVVDCKVALDC